MRYFRLFIILGVFLTIPLVLAAAETRATEDDSKTQGDVEIRQAIIGTWVLRNSFAPTNGLVPFSQTLIYATNGCYSAVETINSDGKTRVKKCQGLWSFQNHMLTYSITNSIGVDPESESFFYPQVKVLYVKRERMCLLEFMDQIAFFRRDSPANKR